jgi:hypothetical protein
VLRGCLAAALLLCATGLATPALADPERRDEGRSCPVDVDADLSPMCPETLQYRPNDRVPRGYQLVERPRKGPLLTGAVIFGLAYVPSVMVATMNAFRHGSAYLTLPFFGPFAAAGSLGPSCEFNDKPGDCAGPFNRSVLYLDGLVQVGGGVLMLIGMSATRTTLMRSDLATVTIVPRLQAASGYGAAVVGTF